VLRPLLCTISLLLALPAGADDGTAVLQRVDAVAEQGEDTTLVLDVTVHDGRGGEAQRVLKIWQKGADRRLIKFLQPVRLEGTGLLVDEHDNLYLYLPAYARVRRVVGSGRGDAFMGTDFSMDDLARIQFGDEYHAELTAEDGEFWHLELIPKVPADHGHDHVTMRVRRSDDLFDRVEFVDDGEVVRRITFDDVRHDGVRPIAWWLKVEDLETGRSTVAIVREIAFDTGLEDDLFTTRYLMRE
jgi:hypothetical protein